jgi:hypothetical protein
MRACLISVIFKLWGEVKADGQLVFYLFDVFFFMGWKDVM